MTASPELGTTGDKIAVAGVFVGVLGTLGAMYHDSRITGPVRDAEVDGLYATACDTYSDVEHAVAEHIAQVANKGIAESVGGQVAERLPVDAEQITDACAALQPGMGRGVGLGALRDAALAKLAEIDPTMAAKIAEIQNYVPPQLWVAVTLGTIAGASVIYLGLRVTGTDRLA